MVSEGDIAPGFTLPSDSGESVSLSDFLGKKVVLYFYPKDGTLGCTQEAKEFRDLVQNFKEEKAIVIGISKDSVDSHRRFKQNNDLPFTLLSDPDGKVLEAYGVWKERSLYGRTFLGIERSTFLIDEKGKVLKVYRNVKPKGHAQVCLLDLSKLTI
jgi:peroxiredoxin Q/BCP